MVGGEVAAGLATLRAEEGEKLEEKMRKTREREAAMAVLYAQSTAAEARASPRSVELAAEEVVELRLLNVARAAAARFAAVLLHRRDL